MSTAIKQLQMPIESLDLSVEFKNMARVNHFTTLSQMLELPIDILLEHPLFGYRMLAEYLSFLTYNELDELIED